MSGLCQHIGPVPVGGLAVRVDGDCYGIRLGGFVELSRLIVDISHIEWRLVELRVCRQRALIAYYRRVEIASCKGALGCFHRFVRLLALGELCLVELSVCRDSL